MKFGNVLFIILAIFLITLGVYIEAKGCNNEVYKIFGWNTCTEDEKWWKKDLVATILIILGTILFILGTIFLTVEIWVLKPSEQGTQYVRVGENEWSNLRNELSIANADNQLSDYDQLSDY